MKKRRLTTTAVLATLLSSSVAPTVTQAAKVSGEQQEIDQSSDEQTTTEKTSQITTETSSANKDEMNEEVIKTTSNEKTNNDSETGNSSSEQQESQTTTSENQTTNQENPSAEVTADNHQNTATLDEKATPETAEYTSDTKEATTTTTSTNISEASEQPKVQDSTPAQTESTQEPKLEVSKPVQENNQTQTSNNQSTPGNQVSKQPEQQSAPHQNNGTQSSGQTTSSQPQKSQQSVQRPTTNQSTVRSNTSGKSNQPFQKAPAPVVTTDASTLLDGTPIKVSPTMTGEEFVKAVGEYAAEVAANNDLYASVMIAQACLETGFGSSSLSQDPYYNFFGIKGSYKGESVTMATQEDGASGMYTINDSFRKYPSPKESFEDYAELMHNDMYKGAWKSNTKTYQDATAYLTGRYATDHQYAEKLNAIIEAYDLTKYDNYDGSASRQLEKIKKEEDIFYSIKLGDTLSKIAEEYNTSVEELQKQNEDKIKDINLIYSGQELKVGTKVTYEYQYNSDMSFSDDNNINASQGDFTLPLKAGSYTVTSPFGNRDGASHNGIDLATPINSSVYAAKDGKVAAIGYDPSAGNYVILDHGNHTYTNYFHLSSQTVKVGDVVKAGQLIAKSGNTGNSTGPHLHFGISNQLWSGYSNPVKYLHF